MRCSPRRGSLPAPFPVRLLLLSLKACSVTFSARQTCLALLEQQLYPYRAHSVTTKDTEMSAGPLEEYTGISGVADEGGDSLTADLNVYYAVCCILASLPGYSRNFQV